MSMFVPTNDFALTVRRNRGMNRLETVDNDEGSSGVDPLALKSGGMSAMKLSRLSARRNLTALMFVCVLAGLANNRPAFGGNYEKNAWVGKYVFLKTETTRLKIKRKVVPTNPILHLYMVEKVQGHWLWVK